MNVTFTKQKIAGVSRTRLRRSIELLQRRLNSIMCKNNDLNVASRKSRAIQRLTKKFTKVYQKIQDCEMIGDGRLAIECLSVRRCLAVGSEVVA